MGMDGFMDERIEMEMDELMEMDEFIKMDELMEMDE
jgi:hypothetical protein